MTLRYSVLCFMGQRIEFYKNRKGLSGGGEKVALEEEDDEEENEEEEEVRQTVP